MSLLVTSAIGESMGVWGFSTLFTNNDGLLIFKENEQGLKITPAVHNILLHEQQIPNRR
jgi:hypothetical protein